MDHSSPSGSADDRVSELFQVAHASLRRLAASYLSRERKDHTLQPTALVNEAFLKLENVSQPFQFRDRSHFQAVAALAMRQILVDHARQSFAQKRGGGWKRVTMSSAVVGKNQEFDVLVLNDALERLAELDPRKARVVELRFFGGLTTAEAAQELQISPKTAEADWYFARAWLKKQMAGNDDE
jgi:RNA polymerase sigma factor (TIGR02999 family)